MLKWAILASFTLPHVVFNQYDLKRLFLNWLMKVNREEELWKLISAMDLKYKKGNCNFLSHKSGFFPLKLAVLCLVSM